MSAVRSCIDQHIIRLSLKPALNYRFQIFIFNLKFFKRQIIHINNEFIIAVLHLCNHIVQVLELMFIHFDHTESLIVILIQDCFDRG